MHPEDGTLQRYLDGELDAPARDTLSRHLETCAACRVELERARLDDQMVRELLEHLDHPVPPIDAESVAGRVVGGRAGGWRRRAAMVLALLGLAAITYAWPGSPVRELVHRVIEPARDRPDTRESRLPSSSQPSGSGIVVVPGGHFTIEFTATQESGMLRVLVTEEEAIAVRVLDGTAVFSTSDDRLLIDNRESAADYEIELPSRAPRVEIRLGTRRLLMKEGPRITPNAPTDTEGRLLFPLH